ncbi:hypothetical protein [Nocardioides stalactiti]|uniref:hypothetical protein n=1 Tax=Nocardioides stalactiti TaxID=2755356 RepID=UPI0015FEEA86|nr:hypothetical protein [Nocardioides stalactiti]
MSSRLRVALLPLTALALATTACQPAEDEDPTDDATSYALVAEDATRVWSAQLDEDWSPTHVISLDNVVIVSSSWEIDEGTEITAFDSGGEVLWTDSGYGGALLAPAGEDHVLICDFAESWTVRLEDGDRIDEGDADDERCPVSDDEAGIAVPRHDEAYTLGNGVLTVASDEGDFEVALEPGVTEIWGVDGGVLTFADATDTVALYR